MIATVISCSESQLRVLVV